MRIVIDMQGTQTESRFRGIGRYTLSFAQAIARNRGKHEIILALNGLFVDAIEPIRAAFDGVLPQTHIRVWHPPRAAPAAELYNDVRRETAELLREAFLASLAPDVVHVSSLFEDQYDDTVTSIGCFDTSVGVSVTLYDLIPLLNPRQYLDGSPRFALRYQQKVGFLKKAALCLAISESTRQEGIAHLDMAADRLVNVSTAADARFQPLAVSDEDWARLQRKLGLTRSFLLYTGNADARKNVPRLIQAFARLPPDLRAQHQLLLTGKMPERDIADLKRHTRTAGLAEDEIVFAGYVDDDELLALYNLCRLFVFPSWHEGFGLPALEAMACGAPVIAANTSSLPEVVGWDAALFDPLDAAAISAKMTEALTDDAFRSALRDHGLRRAQLFSWDATARKAITAWEGLHEARVAMNPTDAGKNRTKPRIAFVSPLPPERTGIADYSAELLPALAEHYDIELIAAQDEVADPWIDRHCTVRDAVWLRAHAHKIDHLIYHVGNSSFHAYMLPLLREFPGTVVLHDFFVSGLVAWLECEHDVESAWAEALYVSHGYHAVRERYLDPEGALRKHPCNVGVLQRAQGLIVHSETSRDLMRSWYGENFGLAVEVIPLLRAPAMGLDRAEARRKLGIAAADFVVCSFGFLGFTKLNQRLLDAWLRSALAKDRRCHLVFVGELSKDAYGRRLAQTIRDGGQGDHVHITGFASSEMFRQYLSAADLAVQLRTHSRGETSAAVLDCMNHALPLIVNGNGSMSELDAQAVWMLPNEFNDAALVEALETLWSDPKRRRALGDRARRVIAERHAPAECARRYMQAIEQFSNQSKTAVPALLARVASIESRDGDGDDARLRALSRSIALSLPLREPAKRLLLDVSATCHVDLRTGIERVARALMLALLAEPPPGWRIEPVYLSDIGGRWHHRYARRYTLGLLDCPQHLFSDDVAEPDAGDVLIALDLSGQTLVEAQRAGLFSEYRARGVAVHALVHDLLPVVMPQVFPPGADAGHARWLHAISTFDGAICVSQAVADDLSDWQTSNGYRFEQRRPFRIAVSHHGADIDGSAPSRGLPADATRTLNELRARPTFLMVGTIEPRKGYLQAIDAFTELWSSGVDVNLVIVGKTGWQGLPDEMRRDIPQTVERLKHHPQAGRRLFWLEGISDEYLENIYAASTCLIAASYGEGFGLPLIEAAQRGLPIIARDIVVFREVAGDHAFYFEAEQASGLTQAVAEWSALHDTGRHPETRGMPWLTWKQSSSGLFELLTRSQASAQPTCSQACFTSPAAQTR